MYSNVQSNTIVNCFKKAEFYFNEEQMVIYVDNNNSDDDDGRYDW
jgi:hypothetical protein